MVNSIGLYYYLENGGAQYSGVVQAVKGIIKNVRELNN
jgi:hypothetical protein